MGIVSSSVPFNPVFSLGVKLPRNNDSGDLTVTFIVEYRIAVTLRGKNRE